MNYNLKHVPFSRFGSYMSISYLSNQKGLSEGIYIRNIRNGDDTNGEIFKIDLIQNEKPVPFNANMSPTELVLKSDGGYIKIIFPEDDYIRFYGENVGLRLTLVAEEYDNAFSHKNSSWQVNVFSEKIRFLLSPIKGLLKVDSKWLINSSTYVIADFVPDKMTKVTEGIIEEYKTVYASKNYHATFQNAKKIVESHYENWKNKTLTTSERYEDGKNIASYITWSSVVKQEGYLTRPAMYMSKNWMTNIWSWDHCFNAMALVQNNPDLAWDQFMIFFDLQDTSGVLPDYANNEYAYWNCSKPPIHGWTLSWMLQRNSNISQDRIKEVYDPLVKWTTYFLRYCDLSENGIPEYYHGNDSGWDNSTVFQFGVPVESPDLCAFLVLQMETLANLAEKLGISKDEKYWRKASHLLLEHLINHFWNGSRFIARYNGEPVDSGDSLLLFIPIVLGDRLPKHIREKLIKDLKEENRFLTEHGLATESIKSIYYEEDGYWRGPIWAPAMMLLIDGIAHAGDQEFASQLSQKYCDMAQKNGMAENFNAKTGAGLRDRAFTWTSSVFLILANEYVK